MRIITNSDGGSRGNPGPAAVGVIIRRENKILEEYSKKIGMATNNIAEYKALIKALELAGKYTRDEVQCMLDSELVVCQLQGSYKVKNKELQRLFRKVKEYEAKFNRVRYSHVRRNDSFQKIADKLVNQALNSQ